MQCYQSKLHAVTFYVFTLIRVISCFRSEEAEVLGPLNEEIPFARNAGNFQEGNENALLRQTEFKRSVDEETAYSLPRMINENFMNNDLMAMSSPVKLREKRSKHSKKISKKSTVDSDPDDSKDELMSILGTIHAAKHHRLSRKDIRKLAKKAFANLKLKKKSPKKSEKNSTQNKKDTEKKSQQKSQENSSDNKETVGYKAQKPAVDEKAGKSVKSSADKTSIEDEKAFARMFDESAKTKTSELSEDITKLQYDNKVNDILSDDKMSKKSSSEGPNIEDLGSKKSISPTESSLEATTTARQIEQELDNEFSMQSNLSAAVSNPDSAKSNPDSTKSNPDSTKSNPDSAKSNPDSANSNPDSAKSNPDAAKNNPGLAEGNADLPDKSAQEKHETSKKSNIPDADRKEKIKTLRTLLAKASKKKVPKKFLGKFPAGLRMIAWRELLDKKKKELEELENMKEDDKTVKKEVKVAEDSHPLTIDINIDPIGDKSAKVSEKKENGLEDAKPSKQNGSHHIASHVKYLQKHLAGAQDLRKLISRALIGHCHATGKRILKAFIAMDRALTRAQKIATVIGKKFKVDASKIENIVVHKEDEVVESFLRDIFANFN